MKPESKKLNIEDMATFCKKKGLVFQAAEIYGGLSGFFDFGPLGVDLKNNLKDLYWKHFVQKREDMSGQDGSIITNPKVWKASGHVDGFGDLVLTTKDTKTKLRADHFIEDELNIPADGMKAKEIQELIDKHGLNYKGEEFEEINDFNLMFNTQVGADTSKSATAYLRPETCQSIFPNFRLIADIQRHKLPFGIVQIGKAFRNEISPRDFLFRCREFEQMEMEYFFNPDSKFDLLTDEHMKMKFNFLSAESQDDNSNKVVEITIADLLKQKKLGEVHAYWLSEFFMWFQNELGLSYENLRVRQHVKTELSHYSQGTFDIDYKYSFGYKEVLGMANRGSFDLTQHQTHSKSKLEFFDESTKTKLLPNVIEPSLGLDRIFLAVLFEAYFDDKDRGNIVLGLPNKIAPYKCAVFPLMNKPELAEVAQKIHKELLDEDLISVYDKSGSIGKRYARQDEVGTPYCLTIDYETIEDGKDKGTVTIRDRDSTEQKRIKVEDVSDVISKLIKGKIDFSEI